MKRNTRGYSLLETTAVVAIIGVLSATALPKLMVHQEQASIVAVEHLAAATTSASHLNLMSCELNRQKPGSAQCLAINDCQQAQQLLAHALPQGFSVLGGPLMGDYGQASSCVLHGADGKTAEITLFRTERSAS